MNLPSPAPVPSPKLTKPLPQTMPPKPSFAVRIAEIAALKSDGSTVLGQRKIPALPDFEQPFAAFAQGTVFKSENGYVAVEDIQPGALLLTADGTCEQVSWIGSAVFAPLANSRQISLTRVMPDSFGVSRPESFMSFGPAARLLQTPPDLRGSTAAARLVTPASRFLDHVNVVQVSPPTPVRLFHVALRRHAALVANGLHVESFHPGYNPVSHMSQTLQSVFRSLFPHIQDLNEFGPMAFTRAPENRDISERA